MVIKNERIFPVVWKLQSSIKLLGVLSDEGLLASADISTTGQGSLLASLMWVLRLCIYDQITCSFLGMRISTRELRDERHIHVQSSLFAHNSV